MSSPSVLSTACCFGLFTSATWLSTDCLLSLANAGCPLCLAVLLLAAVTCCCCSSTSVTWPSTDCLLSLATTVLCLAVLLLAAVVRPPPSCPLVLLPARLSTDRLLSLANAVLSVCPVVSCLLLLLGGVACCQLSPVSLSFAVIIAHSCPLCLTCCLQELLLFSYRPSLNCLPCFAIAVFLLCLVAFRCCFFSAAARQNGVCCHHSCPLCLSCSLQVVPRCQPPPVSLLLAVRRHICLSRLSCSLQLLHDLSHHPSV